MRPARRLAGSCIGDWSCRRLGRDGALTVVFGEMATKLLGENRGSVARRFVLCRVRLGTNDACGLVSRCGH